MKDFILIIPYLNNKDGLLRSLGSVKYPSDLFEVIIVDDGSSIPLTPDDLAEVEELCLQIRILRLNENSGVAKALNAALAELSGRVDYRYIARLDCGDLCVNERFLKQVAFLDKHTDVGLVGSGVLFKNFKTEKSYTYTHHSDYREIQREMHFKCSFIHPSVMFRREILSSVGVYPENYLHCEDYAFFYKIIRLHASCIMPEVLLISEINDLGVSAKNRKRQILSRIRVVNRFGTDFRLKLAGILKLSLLLLIPLRMIRFLNTSKK